MNRKKLTTKLFFIRFIYLAIKLIKVFVHLAIISVSEYKAGRGRAEDDILRYPISNVPQPAATSCLSTRKPGTYHETTTATEPPSTMITNDCIISSSSSPYQMTRKQSGVIIPSPSLIGTTTNATTNATTKHVQFGISQSHKQNNLSLW
ncbi:hypothetical protein Phum_PHUM250590 [Pediculus humanus corporis]|uniref:Uncharacterized protein n=1 Tax=Pediculus humanus subsp. corporis TaxID=121224 RepID=E0VJU0_PEDHC|nr:LOW QUALITY PROTEIN: uncharacterized protein Phum_PHUM250590 [Pediculus humanus corporis]EEB13646.1 hypothetical protein Phum_PHUM250590 [Pediculus humanus corporis]